MLLLIFWGASFFWGINIFGDHERDDQLPHYQLQILLRR